MAILISSAVNFFKFSEPIINLYVASFVMPDLSLRAFSHDTIVSLEYFVLQDKFTLLQLNPSSIVTNSRLGQYTIEPLEQELNVLGKFKVVKLL